MTSQEIQLVISGLREIDALELEEQLPEGSVTTRQAAKSQDVAEHGDFGLTAAVVILSVAAINVLAIWLAKRRQGLSDTTDITMKKTGDDWELKYTASHQQHSSEPPDAASIDAIRTKLTELASVATSSGLQS